jgi:hypothetical protein
MCVILLHGDHLHSFCKMTLTVTYSSLSSLYSAVSIQTKSYRPKTRQFRLSSSGCDMRPCGCTRTFLRKVLPQSLQFSFRNIDDFSPKRLPWTKNQQQSGWILKIRLTNVDKNTFRLLMIVVLQWPKMCKSH